MADRAGILSERVEALARALGAAGVDPSTASRILGTAGAATLQALTLDLLLEPPPAPVAAEQPAPAVVPAIPLAA